MGNCRISKQTANDKSPILRHSRYCLLTATIRTVRCSRSAPAQRPLAAWVLLLALDAQGALAGAPRNVDCSALFASLADHFSSLNIEGAAVCDGELRLFQRGNRQHPVNAIIRFPLATVRAALASGRTDAIDPLAIHSVDLGGIGEVPYSFTDAAALPDGDMVFTAVAEDTHDSYNDGPCHGAAIGVVDSKGRLRSLQPLDHPYKIEGVDARMDGDVIRLLLVTDADDRQHSGRPVRSGPKKVSAV